MYTIDKATILKKSYLLLCLFFANKEISRRCGPYKNKSSLSSLEGQFFHAEASQLLIELAIAIRIRDDQMHNLPEDEDTRIAYKERKKGVDEYLYDNLSNAPLGIREICNKIIHAHTMEPRFARGKEAHAENAKYATDTLIEKPINWGHLNGDILLCGHDQSGKKWVVTIDLEIFIKAILMLFND